MRNFFNSIIDIYAQIYCRIWTYYIRKGWGESTADKAAFSLMAIPFAGDTLLIQSILSLIAKSMGLDCSKVFLIGMLILVLVVILYVGFKVNTATIMRSYERIDKRNRKSVLFLCVYSFFNLTLSFIILEITNTLF